MVSGGGLLTVETSWLANLKAVRPVGGVPVGHEREVEGNGLEGNRKRGESGIVGDLGKTKLAGEEKTQTWMH